MREFNLQSFIISVVIVGVSLVIGIYITSSIGTTICSGADFNATAGNCMNANLNASYLAAGNVTTALSTGTSWISILVVVGFATIILTMLTSGLGATAAESGTPYY